MPKSNHNNPSWEQAGPNVYQDLAKEIQVWSVYFPDFPENISKFSSLLSGDELARADRYVFEKDTRQFVLTRAVLRILLGRYLNRDPQKLKFDFNEMGKPFLTENPGEFSLAFNVSHSGDFALIVFSRNPQVGIDIEKIDSDRDMNSIAAKNFAGIELKDIEMLPSEEKLINTFHYWCLKEAVIKGIGEGMKIPLRDIEIHMDWTNNKGRIQCSARRELEKWEVRLLSSPRSDYVAAMAIETTNLPLRCLRFPDN